MSDDPAPATVPEGFEEIAKAAAELRAFRGAGGCEEAAKSVGVSGVQWWHWERSYLPGHPRPGDVYREKLHIVLGIAPWRWRTRKEQQEINDLRDRTEAKQERAAAAGSDEGGAS